MMEKTITRNLAMRATAGRSGAAVSTAAFRLAFHRNAYTFVENRDASRKIGIGVRRTSVIPSFMIKPGMTNARSFSTAASPARTTSCAET
jgi:ABC-type xylose transport system permease subunit